MKQHDSTQQLASRWRILEEKLTAIKSQINRSIREYPPPIPACDDQFNYLLERRSAISRDLSRMTAARERSLQNNDVTILEEFIAGSPFIDSAELTQEAVQR